MKKFAVILLLILPFFMYISILIVGYIFKPPAWTPVQTVCFAYKNGDEYEAGKFHTIEKGEELQLYYKISPEQATNQEVTFTVISENGAATVNEKGVVKGLKVGQATIVITTEDRGKNASVTVNVVSYEVEEIILTDLDGKTVITELTRRENETIELYRYFKIEPGMARDKEVTFFCSDESVASISGATIACKKAGTAQITIKSVSNPEVTAVLTINVVDNYLKWDLPPGSTISVGGSIALYVPAVILNVIVDESITVEGGYIKYSVLIYAGAEMEIDETNLLTITGSTAGAARIKAVYVDFEGNPVKDGEGNEYYIELNCIN